MNYLFEAYRVIHWAFNKLCPLREISPPEIPSHKLPWLWVGATVNDDEITVTNIVNRNIKYSKLITSDSISEITGYSQPIHWKYIDIKTLEEKEFPSEGFLIEDDDRS
jgi:hypothetical protein